MGSWGQRRPIQILYPHHLVSCALSPQFYSHFIIFYEYLFKYLTDGENGIAYFDQGKNLSVLFEENEVKAFAVNPEAQVLFFLIADLKLVIF